MLSTPSRRNSSHSGKSNSGGSPRSDTNIYCCDHRLLGIYSLRSICLNRFVRLREKLTVNWLITQNYSKHQHDLLIICDLFSWNGYTYTVTLNSKRLKDIHNVLPYPALTNFHSSSTLFPLKDTILTQEWPKYYNKLNSILCTFVLYIL